MEALALLFALALIAGWLLGVIGFFKALSARAEIAALRRRVEALTARQPASEAVQPAAGSMPLVPPTVVGESELEPVPATAEPAAVAFPATQPASEKPDIEALLTARWGVWLGAAALMLAGVFLIRYAVEQGLLGPTTRCVLAALLGVALIAAAEWLGRRESTRPAIPDRAAPALAAGGVAVLFGAAYGAGPLYSLVPPLAGFILLAAASLIGLAISLRHGQLVAAVGILGAFVTPALVQTQNPSLPGLFGYLLFVTATALGVLRYAAWVWLGWATTIAGAVWVLLAFVWETDADIWAPALFVPAAPRSISACCRARPWIIRLAVAWPGFPARRSGPSGC
jgi:uncharacterized membrane protein